MKFKKLLERSKQAKSVDPGAEAQGCDLFISYKREEGKPVLEVKNWLEHHGLPANKIFMDVGSIDGALRFTEVIAQAIRECKVVLFFVSKESVQSNWIKNEIFYARKYKKPVFPIYLEKTSMPPDLDFIIGEFQHLELFKGEKNSNFNVILKSIVNLGIPLEEETKPGRSVQQTEKTAGQADDERKKKNAPAPGPPPRQVETPPTPKKVQEPAEPADQSRIGNIRIVKAAAVQEQGVRIGGVTIAMKPRVPEIRIGRMTVI